jgi:hypothetical protein
MGAPPERRLHILCNESDSSGGDTALSFLKGGHMRNFDFRAGRAFLVSGATIASAQSQSALSQGSSMKALRGPSVLSTTTPRVSW